MDESFTVAEASHLFAYPDGQVAQIYRKTARIMSAKLSLRSRDFSGAFPKTVIESN